MKRKILSILMCLVLVLAISGCFKEEVVKATIVEHNGTTSEMSAEEIIDLHKKDITSYDMKFYKAQVTVTSKVTKINKNKEYSDKDRKYQACAVELKGGFKVMVDANSEVLKTLKKGKKIKVNSANVIKVGSVYVSLSGTEEIEVPATPTGTAHRIVPSPTKTQIEIVK